MEVKARKRRALKVEPFEAKLTIESTFKGVTDPRYQHVKHPNMNIYYVYCSELAEFKAHFKTQGVTVTEKYCKACLDKLVIVPYQIP